MDGGILTRDETLSHAMLGPVICDRAVESLSTLFNDEGRA